MLPTALPPLPTTDALTLRTKRLCLIPITRAHAPAMFQVLKDSVSVMPATLPANLDSCDRLY
jgi:hypothetical protein